MGFKSPARRLRYTDQQATPSRNGEHFMSELPPTDIMTAALAMALCDLFIAEWAKLQAVLRLLEQKGLLSSAESSEAIQSTASLAPELAEENSQRLQQRLRERMETRLQELMLHLGATGPTQ
jgi:hypothetical protein